MAEELGEWVREQANRRTADTDADMEPDDADAPDGTDEAQALHPPFRVTFHHTRKRLADIDNLSGKAALDGIVMAGILPDDSAKYITEVTHCQKKGSVEGTKIVIESIDGSCYDTT